jgi:DNA-binding HxlR family transcriptional regulator
LSGGVTLSQYGQFCPVAKVTELLGEKWMLLILRELLLGSSRYNEFQRALSRISPTLLTKRLKQLESAGIILRKKQQGRKGYEYLLTPVGRELSPIVVHMATWGMRWARGQLDEDELDVEFLMWDIHRRLQMDMLPDGETVMCFIFEGLSKFSSWWLIINESEVDLCTENPGKDVDLYVRTTLPDLVAIWSGDIEIKTTLRKQLLKPQGNSQLVKTMPQWLGICLYADIHPGHPTLMKVTEDETQNG